MSQRYHDMLGFGPGELEPGFDGLRALTHPDDLAALERAFDRLATPGQDAYSVEVRLRRKAGD